MPMKDAIDFPGALTPDLDQLDAFDAMRLFLEAYWERGGKTSDDIAILLGSIDRGLGREGGPVDIAQWFDWLEAVNRVQLRRRDG